MNNLSKPCILSNLSLSNSGYARKHIHGKGLVFLHRHVWELANGRTLLPGEVVRHTCDIKNCIEESHLIVGSYSDNMNDAVLRGKHGFKSHSGTSNGMSVLTKEAIVDIRQMYKEEYSLKEIAKEFNISYNTVYRIVTRQTYKNII